MGRVRVMDEGASYVPSDFGAADAWPLDRIAEAFATGYDFGDGSTASLRRKVPMDSGLHDVHIVREDDDGDRIEDAKYVWVFAADEDEAPAPDHEVQS